ncbi:MAG: non-canonical purine NTP pyrophosphatase [Clostridia bacterium]|nr:non-canonical purine NTP pyrophosphatase [Clostridia bacterium]
MKVLIGTTNPSKVKRFEGFLEGCDVEFVTLNDLGIKAEPEECGSTPEENAVLKAKFYSRYFDTVICNDSGLYFEGIPLDDPRQPGLNIRTPLGGRRLDDEEMIEYYSRLIGELGGKVRAYYLDGIAVCKGGKVYSFMENSEATKVSAFFMVDKPSDKRHLGWSLDSLSVNKNTLTYFVDAGNNMYDNVEEQIVLGEYRKRVVAFLKKALGLCVK